jgi:hypothetical protein
MRTRVAAAAVLAVVLAAGIAVAAHRSESAPPVGALGWADAPPQVFRLPTMPRDRVAVGRVQNTSLRTLRLTAAALVVRDRRGRPLPASAGFTTSYAHGLFGAFQQPSSVPTAELLRLGRVVELKPGTSAPFYAAWRLPRGAAGEPEVRVDYGAGTLVLPAARVATAR